MEKQITVEQKNKKRNLIVQYDSLDAALKAKNDLARAYLKNTKLPN